MKETSFQSKPVATLNLERLVRHATTGAKQETKPEN